MREIKFRGLTIYGEWAYGLLSRDERGWFISNDHGKPFAFHVRPETIGQFTGLHDENGVEVYEGDIVQSETDWNFGTAKIVGKIVYQEKKAVFVIEGEIEKNDRSFHIFDCWRCEVIGNIHENPEALKEGGGK